MRYAELISHLFSPQMRSTINRGMQRCNRLRKIIGSPDSHYKTIHVAGTNGKGSVCTKIAMGLQEAGFKVGLFTSPHITCYRERICIQGEKISEKSVERLLSPLLIKAQEEGIKTTFFEATTLLALHYFAEQQVDFAVIETGIGGRHDTTNMLSPILSVITSIALDHTRQLGNSLEEIAWEKGGIIKPKTPVVIGPQVPVKIMTDIAVDKEAPLYVVEGTFSDFEEENREVAKEALKQLAAPSDALEKGLEATPPCRAEKIMVRGKTLYLDGAHNPSAMKSLFKKLRRQHPHKLFYLLFSLASDKDLVGCLKVMQEQGAHVACVPMGQNTFFSPDKIYSHCIKIGISPSNISCPTTLEEGFEQALAHPDAIPVICGSFRLLESFAQLSQS